MKVLNPPKEIWLCVGEVDDGADFKDLATEEIGWSTDQIYEADVRYVLAPEAEPRRGTSWPSAEYKAEAPQKPCARCGSQPAKPIVLEGRLHDRLCSGCHSIYVQAYRRRRKKGQIAALSAEEEDSLRERSRLFQKPAER